MQFNKRYRQQVTLAVGCVAVVFLGWPGASSAEVSQGRMPRMDSLSQWLRPCLVAEANLQRLVRVVASGQATLQQAEGAAADVTSACIRSASQITQEVAASHALSSTDKTELSREVQTARDVAAWGVASNRLFHDTAALQQVIVTNAVACSAASQRLAATNRAILAGHGDLTVGQRSARSAAGICEQATASLAKATVPSTLRHNKRVQAYLQGARQSIARLASWSTSIQTQFDAMAHLHTVLQSTLQPCLAARDTLTADEQAATTVDNVQQEQADSTGVTTACGHAFSLLKAMPSLPGDDSLARGWLQVASHDAAALMSWSTTVTAQLQTAQNIAAAERPCIRATTALQDYSFSHPSASPQIYEQAILDAKQMQDTCTQAVIDLQQLAQSVSSADAQAVQTVRTRYVPLEEAAVQIVSILERLSQSTWQQSLETCFSAEDHWFSIDGSSPYTAQSLSDMQGVHSACEQALQQYASFASGGPLPQSVVGNGLALASFLPGNYNDRSGIAVQEEEDWSRKMLGYLSVMSVLSSAATGCITASNNWNANDLAPVTPTNINQQLQDIQALNTACAAEAQQFAAYTSPNSFPLESDADFAWIQASVNAGNANVTYATLVHQTLLTDQTQFAHDDVLAALTSAAQGCITANNNWNANDVGPITPANIGRLLQDVQALNTACAAEAQQFSAYTSPNSFPLESDADAAWIQANLSYAHSDVNFASLTYQALLADQASFGPLAQPTQAPDGAQPTQTPVVAQPNPIPVAAQSTPIPQAVQATPVPDASGIQQSQTPPDAAAGGQAPTQQASAQGSNGTSAGPSLSQLLLLAIAIKLAQDSNPSANPSTQIQGNPLSTVSQKKIYTDISNITNETYNSGSLTNAALTELPNVDASASGGSLDDPSGNS
jgi:hypothetical protein